jgi:hypothetical protein
MKYRTKDGQDYTLPGIGRTVNGSIVTDQVIENPNFELVEDTPPAAPPATPLAAPSPVPQPAPAPPAPQINQGSSI